VHVVDEGVDTGPVIRQVALEIEPGETEEHLHERIKTIERKLIVDTVFDIAHNRINLKELARS
jgi:phosphoribosylglycinamide formyltransferase-1